MFSLFRKVLLSVMLAVTMLVAAACGDVFDVILDYEASFSCDEVLLTLYVDEKFITPVEPASALIFDAATFDHEVYSPIRLFDGAGNSLLDVDNTIPVDGGEDWVTIAFPYIVQPQANPITLEIVAAPGVYDEEEVVVFSASGDCGDLVNAVALFTDGRVNNSLDVDAAAPVAIYINDSLVTIDIYAVNPQTGAGTLVIRHPLSTDAPPAENELVAEASNPFTTAIIRIYRLSSGEYQVVAGYDNKEYSVLFPADGTSITHIAG